MKLGNDAPINEKSADRYGWSSYAKSVARVLGSADVSGSSFVASVQGPWGSGKTSFLHLVEGELVSADDCKNAKAIWFNPWLFQNERDLLVSFFRLLLEETGLDETEHGKRIATKLGEYLLAVIGDNGGLIQSALTAVPGVGLVAGAVAGVGSSLAKHTSSNQLEHSPCGNLFSLKVDLDKELGELDHKVIVFFDDLDRLSKEEMCLVFKTVTLTASFPNIIYVLAFDRQVVAKALAEVQGFDGASYLEKVVQLPIDVPPLNRGDALSRIDQWVDELYNASSFELSDEERSRLVAVARGLAVPFLTTPRQLGRFENALQAKRLQVNDEICPVDLLGMVAVQLFMPEVFAWIKDNATFLCGLEQIDFISGNRKCDGRLAGLEGLIEHCGTPAQAAREGLAALFPRVAQESYGLNFSQGPRSKIHSGRVRNAALLQHFLGYETPSALSHARAKTAIESSDEGELRECLDSEWRHGDLNEIVWMIEDDFEALTEERLCLLVRNLVPYLAKCREERPTLLGALSFDRELSHLLLLGSRRFGPKRLTDSFLSAVTGSSEDNLVPLARVFRDEAATRAGDGATTWMTDEGFVKFAKWYSSRVEESVDEVLASGYFEPLVAWHMAEDALGGDAYSRFRESLEGNSTRAVLYLASSLASWRGASSRGFSLPDGSHDEFGGHLRTAKDFAESKQFLIVSSRAQVRVAALLALLEMEEGGGLEGRVSFEEALRSANAARKALGAGPIEDESQIW